MTVTTAEPTTPIRAVLFDSPDQAAVALTDALRSADTADEIRGRLGRMADVTKDAVVGEVGGVAGELLEMDVGAVFDRAWSRYAALVHAAEETVGDPETIRLIELITHKVSVAYEPRVEVYLRSHRIATVTVRLELTLTLRGVLVEIRDGCVTGLRAGDCVIDGALTIAGQPVTSREVTLDLTRDIPFPAPIRLAGDAEI